MWKGILAVLLLTASTLTLANNGPKCITLEDKVYCPTTVEKVDVGGIELKITDPAALLRAAGRSRGGLKKTGFYDDYEQVPIVVELAKQQGMEYKEFIKYMIDNWSSDKPNPFQALYELELVYNDIPPEFEKVVVDHVVMLVLTDVLKAIGKNTI